MTEFLFVLAVLVLLVLFLVRPGRVDPMQEAKFRGRNFAHRGLYTKDQKVPENSLTAFENAAAAGYGIELDVQLSKDGEVVVFHDDTLDRVTGTAGRVDHFLLEELKKMPLFGTDQRIPLFREVLETINGRVPLIVEFKTGPRNRELCKKTWELLQEYAGDFCVESFDPRIVGWFKSNVPHILRGQLACGYRDYKRKTFAFIGSRMLCNFLGRPQFIAWGSDRKNCMVRLCEAFGPVKIRWNTRDPQAAPDIEQEYDAVIFEHYAPSPEYNKE